MDGIISYLYKEDWQYRYASVYAASMSSLSQIMIGRGDES
jgi:hypothetical protein